MREYAQDVVIQRYRDAIGLSERQQLGEALLNKALGVYADDGPDGAIQLLDEVVALFRRAQEPELKILAASALRRKAAILNETTQGEAALAVYEEVIARYGGDAEAEHPQVQAAVGAAYYAKGYAHQLRDEKREAKLAYLNGREYLLRVEEIESQRILAALLGNLGFCLAKDRDKSGARIFLDELEDLFGSSTDASIMEIRDKGRELRTMIDAS